MLNTKQLGNIAEVECMLAFLKLGYNVLTPYGDCERYDFVVDINNHFYRIQVKKANENHIEEGYIKVKNCSKSTKNGQIVMYNYTKEDIDYIMTYYNNQCYLIPVEEIGSREKVLRFVPPKNGQKKGITFASEYELEKVVKKLLN